MCWYRVDQSRHTVLIATPTMPRNTAVIGWRCLVWAECCRHLLAAAAAQIAEKRLADSIKCDPLARRRSTHRSATVDAKGRLHKYNTKRELVKQLFKSIWVTVRGYTVLVGNQVTQVNSASRRGHLFMGRRNDYQRQAHRAMHYIASYPWSGSVNCCLDEGYHVPMGLVAR